MKASPPLFALLSLCLLLATACNRTGAAQAESQPSEQPPAEPTQIANYIIDIFEDSKGYLWFGTISKGAARYDGKELTYLTKADGLLDNRVASITEDKDGNLWFGNENGLVRYDGVNFKSFSAFSGNISADHKRISNVLIDDAGDFWIGTWGGFYRYDGTSFSEFKLPRTGVDTVWNQDTKNWSSVNMIDSEGNVWFSNDAYGATKWDGKTFTHFTEKEGLPSNSVTSVTEDTRGHLWFGTRVSEKDHPDPAKRFGAGGLSRYDGKTFTHFPDYPGLSENDVYTTYADKSGNVWISTISDGLYRYDGKEFTNYKPEEGENPIPFFGIQSMLEDSKGNFWIGCSGGLFRLEGEQIVNVTQDGPWN